MVLENRSMNNPTRAVRELLKKYDLRPNKALGQNFLCDPAAVREIIHHLEPDGKNILEIGPGLGVLTREICQRANRAAAVEIDADMVKVLSSELAEFGNLTIIHSDFLKTDFRKLCEVLGNEISVAGNLPYYITTPIIMRLLTFEPLAERMVLMVQSEAAERFFARPKDRVYGPLTVLAKTAYDISTVFHVPSSAFFPAPQVDSVVVKLTRKEKPMVSMNTFSELLQAAFAMRRKTLANNLFAKGVISREETVNHLEVLGFLADSRAESLSPEQLLEFFVRSGLLN